MKKPVPKERGFSNPRPKPKGGLENPPSGGEIILYQTEDGQTRIQCRFEDEAIWLTQAQIAELFQTSVPNINLHLKAIYGESELTEAATIKSYLIVRSEGSREVSREVLLPGMGAISREQADELAHKHYARFEQRRRTAAELEAEEDAVKQLTETAKKLPADKKKGGKA